MIMIKRGFWLFLLGFWAIQFIGLVVYDTQLNKLTVAAALLVTAIHFAERLLEEHAER